MTLSNRDLLHAALMGSDNRAVPALGRAVKLTPAQLVAAMNAKAKQLGLKNTRFQEPTGLSVNNVSTPREVIAMLKQVIANPVLGPITHRARVRRAPGRQAADHVQQHRSAAAAAATCSCSAARPATTTSPATAWSSRRRSKARTYYMAFLGDEGKLTRFGDVARVADWIVSHKPKTALAAPRRADAPAAAPAPAVAPSRPRRSRRHRDAGAAAAAAAPLRERTKPPEPPVRLRRRRAEPAPPAPSATP